MVQQWNGHTPLLTVQEVAELLRLDIKAVQRLCRDGKLPARKIEKKWRVSLDDLQTFVEEDK